MEILILPSIELISMYVLYVILFIFTGSIIFIDIMSNHENIHVNKTRTHISLPSK